MEKEKKIIHIMYGGLGDNLQYSTLPEKFVEKGFDVYISDKSEWRNQEIYDLVWALNPYVKGLSSDIPNSGSVKRYISISDDFSIIEDWEAIHKLKPTNKYPKIYYQPRFVEAYADKTFIDLHYSSTYYDENKLNKLVNEIPGDDIVKILFSSAVASKKCDCRRFKKSIIINSIFDYCDLIYSCKKLHTLFTGNSVLASAIIQDGEKKCECIVNQHYFDTKNYIFDNINYTIC